MVYSLTGSSELQPRNCGRRLRALTYPRDGPLRQTSGFHCFLNIAPLRVVWRKLHSLIVEILEEIKNDIFGDYSSSMRLKPAIKLEIVFYGCFRLTNVYAFYKNRGCI